MKAEQKQKRFEFIYERFISIVRSSVVDGSMIVFKTRQRHYCILHPHRRIQRLARTSDAGEFSEPRLFIPAGVQDDVISHDVLDQWTTWPDSGRIPAVWYFQVVPQVRLQVHTEADHVVPWWERCLRGQKQNSQGLFRPVPYIPEHVGGQPSSRVWREVCVQGTWGHPDRVRAVHKRDKMHI